jgi:hypothetical protein
MNIEARKLSLIQEFLSIQNESFIVKLEKLISKEKKTTNVEFKPFTLEEFNNRIEKSLDDFKNGRTINNDDLLKEIDTWQ